MPRKYEKDDFRIGKPSRDLVEVSVVVIAVFIGMSYFVGMLRNKFEAILIDPYRFTQLDYYLLISMGALALCQAAVLYFLIRVLIKIPPLSYIEKWMRQRAVRRGIRRSRYLLRLSKNSMRSELLNLRAFYVCKYTLIFTAFVFLIIYLTALQKAIELRNDIKYCNGFRNIEAITGIYAIRIVSIDSQRIAGFDRNSNTLIIKLDDVRRISILGSGCRVSKNEHASPATPVKAETKSN